MPRTYVERIAKSNKLPIVDAKTAVRIMVTATDVVNAQKANSKSCALARAAARLPDVEKAFFFRGTAYLQRHSKMERFVLPPSVTREIVCFDRTRVFAPGSYQLTPPPASRSKKETANYRASRKTNLAKLVASTEKIGPGLTAGTKVSNKAPLTAAIKKIASQDKPNQTKEQRQFDARVSAVLDKPKRHQHRTQYVRDAREPK